MRTTLAQLEKELKSQKAGLAAKDKEVEKDESVQDDTEWVNDYHNQKGWVEALEYAISLLKAPVQRVNIAHYSGPKGIPCKPGTNTFNTNSTKRASEVTCKRCLKSMHKK